MLHEPGKKYGIFPILLLASFPLLLICVSLVLSKNEWLSEITCYMQCSHVPDHLFKSGSSAKEQRFLEYDKTGQFVAARFSTALPDQQQKLISAVETAAVASNHPVLSIVVDEDDLHDSLTGILANPFKRGRNWERLAHVTYFDNGHALFSGGAGIRVHGGRSRNMKNPSFRLYFREIYGQAHLPEQFLFDGVGDPIKSIVVHNDFRWITRRDGSVYDTHFSNPLAFDIAERIGSITPATKPVQMYLNGDPIGAYVLMEHHSLDFLRARFGDGDFTFGRGKPDSMRAGEVAIGDPEILWNLRNEFATAEVPLRMEVVNERVRLANMTNWVIGILVTGVTDAFQGSIVRDASSADSRWFWINWDMDHAFKDIYSLAPLGKPWEIDLFRGAQTILNRKRTRGLLFDRLSRESPEFRSYFLRRFVDALNHQATSAFVRERADFYRNLSVSFGVDNEHYMAIVSEYAGKRPAILRQQVSEYFNAGPAHQLEIDAPESLNLSVDGYSSATGYIGWYYNETSAKVQIAPDHPNTKFIWYVNGERRPVSSNELNINVTSDLSVQIIPINQ